MLLRILLLSSLLINGYLYVFHFNTSEVIVKTVQTKPEVQVTQKNPLKKSRLSASDDKKIAASPEDSALDKSADDLYFDPHRMAFEDFVNEKLKYQLNLSESKIESYEKLKKFYREATNNVFNIPPTHDPEDPYIPSFKENKKYYDLIAEYHNKLRELFGSEQYQRYERMRKENNKRVMLDWQNNEGTPDLQYMQF